MIRISRATLFHATLWFIAGFSVSWVIASAINADHLASLYDKFKPLRAPDSSYPLINPLLTYNVPETKEFEMNTALERTLQHVVDTATSNGAVQSLSLYYRDLLAGHWVGINPTTPYNPASLMKIALVIAYERQADTNPAVLQQSIVYTKALSDAIALVPFQTPSKLLVGQSYTIQKLIESLMIDSDNGAKNALLSRINPRVLADVYSDLGITDPSDVTGNYTISAKAYSLFFRILYNATYMSRAASEHVLELLVKARYTNGLVAGVPSDVRVAQKFGEYIATDAGGNPTGYELHDCGIVYKPNHPYLPCIMTRGSVIENLTKTIQDISRLLYQQAP